MGYILPVTPYTYANYHYRMAEKNQPHQINAPYKVVFHEIKETYDFHRKNHVPKESQMKEKPDTVPLYSFQVDQVKKAEITGKGGVINKQI